MIKRDALYSSNTGEWETPQEFFDELNREFSFDLDVCATGSNAKCNRYYSLEEDGLRQPWIGRVWCNPPYGRDTPRWLAKASDEILANAELIVMLIPARTGTRWFHEYVYNKPGIEIRFVKGRLKFGGGGEQCTVPEHACNL